MSFVIKSSLICDECRKEIPTSLYSNMLVDVMDLGLHHASGSTRIEPKYRFDFCCADCRREWGDRHSRINETAT